MDAADFTFRGALASSCWSSLGSPATFFSRDSTPNASQFAGSPSRRAPTYCWQSRTFRVNSADPPSESQAFECMKLDTQIAREEDQAGHRRTVLLGDLNMNPFEPGLVGAGGLNAVMSRQIASRATRTVQGTEYRFFYNPMWGHFGDRRNHTAGSYFYASSEHVSYYWKHVRSGFDPAGTDGAI